MIKKKLICTLCVHIISEKIIIELFEKENTHHIEHCINCNTLHITKKINIKRWLGFAFQHPFRFKVYTKLVKKYCIQCHPLLLVQWNGRCPQCNSELLLRVTEQ